MIHKREYVKYAIPIFLLIAFSMTTYFIIKRANEKQYLKVAFLDVGQGDAIFIQSPNNKQILIDSGNGKQLLPKLMRVMPLFDRSIDVVLITNPDEDHIGGLSYVLNNYKIGMVLEPGTGSETLTYKNLKELIRKKEITERLAKSGQSIVLDENISLDVLFPDRDVSDWERNDGSIVARLSYKDISFMLMGDATRYTEYLIRQNEDDSLLKSDVLKLGHHGSHTSSSLLWLETVDPSVAIISAGKNNRYGHPSEEVISNLQSLGIKYFSTFQNGNIVFKTDGKQLIK